MTLHKLPVLAESAVNAMRRSIDGESMSEAPSMHPEEIELICAQIGKATAEATRIEAETDKIKAETTKILQEHRYYPKVAFGALLVSAVGTGAAIVKLWLDA